MSDIQVELVSGSPPERATRDTFLEVRSGLDLTRFEFTHRVRIEEGAIPHSHPVLTLGTGSPNGVALLASYLHEQLHWFVWERENAHPEAAEGLSAELREQYPNPPVGLPEGAEDEESSYLHYVVNHLELTALGELLGEERAERYITRKPFYTEIYATVVRDRESLGVLLDRHGFRLGGELVNGS